MDFNQLEQEALGLFEEGEFEAARHLFEKLEQTSGSQDRGVHSFNKACCHAAEGQAATALGELLDLGHHQDARSLYNMALCLVNSRKPEVALALLDKLDSETSDHLDGSLDGMRADFALLLMHCSERLDLFALSKAQCKILERLLVTYKQEIIGKTHDDDKAAAWQRNLAHVLLAQDTRFEECARLLEGLLPGDGESLLRAELSLLGQLCVAYILTGRNRDAEELLREIEQEEAAAGENTTTTTPGSLLEDKSSAVSQPHHLVEVNLAIGTLYCVKNNYEFGLGRIFKSLEPLNARLTQGAWTQAKRCLLSALDKHCKQSLCLRDELLEQMLDFLIECEAAGLQVAAYGGEGGVAAPSPEGGNRNLVAYEARHLRSILLTIVHD